MCLDQSATDKYLVLEFSFRSLMWVANARAVATCKGCVLYCSVYRRLCYGHAVYAVYAFVYPY